MPVSLDHEAYLGDRVELIAAEKAGIIKPGCPVVVGAQETETAQDVLIETADRLGAPVTVYGQDFLAYEENGRMVYQDEDGPDGPAAAAPAGPPPVRQCRRGHRRGQGGGLRAYASRRPTAP